ncbi:nose resistant to fluoxetine protein 6-like [Asbolus verrucosus]|uniref:Nose resistant to fluoxetine protein 6-like n=1 Tax=Asbolus verrucosus TaxID=1661398 RepID=A0A482V9U2_ASBVE|nr:nose resistant to fluoxetine protein 6-like [Asbolus verrucosus]
MSFSVWNNLKKLSSETENHDGLHCIHGIKVISMFLIIMGHRIMFIIGSPIVNPNFVEEMYGKLETSVLLNGPIIVDTFFNITGFLSCYSMLVIFEKRKKSIYQVFIQFIRNQPYYFQFCRLTPVYAVVLGFYCTIFVKLGSGPFWLERIQVEQERCVVNWWTNILYLNNYIQKDQICMFQSWYMTCDFHFFLIAPVIVWLLRKKPNLGVGVLFIIIILSISVVFAIVYLTQENAILLLYMKFLKDPVVNNTFKNIYIPTHMRGTPYFVGMLAGYLKYHLKTKKYKIPRYVVYTGWIICVFVIEITVYTAFIFYIPEKAYDVTMSAIYGSMHHLTWSICISWIILVVSEGNGAWIQQLLCWKPLHILSKITYAAFLCHGAIQLYSVATLRYANYIFNTAGDISLAFLCGLILSMLFEAPILGLEKITLGKAVKVNAENKSDVSTVVVPKIKIIHQCG